MHPTRVVGSVEEAVVTIIVRDHDNELLDRHTDVVFRLAAELERREPRARVTIATWDQYRNMREVIEQHPRIVGNAEEAMRRVGSSRCTRSSAVAPTAPA